MRVRKLFLFAREVPRVRSGEQSHVYFQVQPRNSTVLGSPAKSYWPGLHFEAAEYRSHSLRGDICGDSTDIHLAVPWRHEEDTGVPVEDCGKYAVRPVWQAGDWLRVNGSRKFFVEVLSVVPELTPKGWFWLVVFRRRLGCEPPAAAETVQHGRGLPREGGSHV